MTDKLQVSKPDLKHIVMMGIICQKKTFCQERCCSGVSLTVGSALDQIGFIMYNYSGFNGGRGASFFIHQKVFVCFFSRKCQLKHEDIPKALY